jgi:hypothetical protein
MSTQVICLARRSAGVATLLVGAAEQASRQETSMRACAATVAAQRHRQLLATLLSRKRAPPCGGPGGLPGNDAAPTSCGGLAPDLLPYEAKQTSTNRWLESLLLLVLLPLEKHVMQLRLCRTKRAKGVPDGHASSSTSALAILSFDDQDASGAARRVAERGDLCKGSKRAWPLWPPRSQRVCVDRRYQRATRRIGRPMPDGDLVNIRQAPSRKRRGWQ